MKVYVCRRCLSTLHRCSDTRKAECPDCHEKVNISSLDERFVVERAIGASEAPHVLEART